jgi:cell division protein ZapA (FtsZ GTPase activity inhibitor)
VKKNVAGQKIGAQMITAADGSVFAGAVTVYVTGDAGTQAAGSVGSGACTHEGNGYHTYAPAQAETNYDLIAFTFIGTGAVAATVQVYPSFPQTTDPAASIAAILLDTAEIGAAGAGLTALASAENLATVAGYIDTEVAAIKAKTDNLPAAPAATGDCITAAGVRTAVGLASANLDTQIGTLATASALSTVAGYVDTEVAAIKAKTDNLPATPAATGDCITAAGVRTAVGLASANLDTQIGTLATASALSTVAGYIDTEVAAIKAKTDSLTFTEAGKIDANLLSIGTDTAAAAAFKRAVMGNTLGTVGSASTTTSVVTSSITPAASVADQFKGRILTFAQDTTTAALRGQATDITASTSGGVLTVTALTTAPASGDTFAIT